MPTETVEATVESSLTWLSKTLDQVLDETEHLCRIPAPTFDEGERAAYVAKRMRAIGLDQVQIDSIHNVTGILGDRAKGPTTLVVAHSDTVFPHHTSLDVRRTKQRLYGPSIGDNSVAVVAMLQVAEVTKRLHVPLPGRVIFAASVGEEGLGNLCGIRALLDTWQGQIDTVLAVEGHGLDELRQAGIGSTRLEVTFQGPGGHSWGAFGTPSAIHAMGQAIHKISQLGVPQNPRTTYNVGLIEGGESINTIAPRASMLVDLRSVDPTSLGHIETQVKELFRDIEEETKIRVTSRIVGQRPAATLDVSHSLCRGAQAIRKKLRLRPGIFCPSSTDANLPLSQGIPALCLGITRGGLAHTVKEYIEIAPIVYGLKQLFLMTLYTLSHTECGRWDTE